MPANFYVVARTTHWENSHGGKKSSKRYRYRIVKAGLNHDKSISRYLAFYPVSGLSLPEIRVINPSEFRDIDIAWVVAQTAIHEPAIALGDYYVAIVKSGKQERFLTRENVAQIAISQTVYNWAGVECTIDNEEAELY